MIDVSSKFNTLRSAHARGHVYVRASTLELARNGQIPKGDIVEIARSAAIMAAKKTPDWIVFCHPIPLDFVDVSVKIQQDKIQVDVNVKAIAKTGVEMEALTSVSAALLNIYDMIKPVDDEITISDIRLLEKKGGKSDYKEDFATPLHAAVLVISDSTFSGIRKDKSGKFICTFLEQQKFVIDTYEILPDNQEQIQQRLFELVNQKTIDLIMTTGGTGLGPKDVTPEATRSVIEKEIPGITEAIRHFGKERTPYAMLSRQVCGLAQNTLIINLPGSSKGVKESLEALFPGLLHAFPMLWDEGHETISP